jgi:hypothetical protein
MAALPPLPARRLVIDAKCRTYPAAVTGPNDFSHHDGGEVDARIVLRSGDISPYCLDPVRREVLFVEVPTGVDLDAFPFYYQGQYESATSLIAVGYDALHAVAAEAPDVNGLLLLYSVGRCGSTLISRLLRETPGVRSLSEPDVFTALTPARQRGELTNDEVSALVASCTRIICAPRTPDDAPMVAIKFRSFSIDLAADFAQWFPTARAVFLYRDADTWATSTMRAFPPAESPADQSATQDRLGLLMPLLAEYRAAQGRLLTPTEAMACHWVALMRGAQTWQSTGADLIGLRYEDLLSTPRAALAALYAYAGMQLPPDETVDAVLATDSQAGTTLARDNLDGRPHRDVDTVELARVIADLESGRSAALTGGTALTAGTVLPGTWRPTAVPVTAAV